MLWNRFAFSSLSCTECPNNGHECRELSGPHFTSEGTKMDQKSARPEGQSFGAGVTNSADYCAAEKGYKNKIVEVTCLKGCILPIVRKSENFSRMSV